MKKIVITCGLIAGAIVTGMMVITTAIYSGNMCEFKNGEIIGYGTMLLAFSLIFVGIKMFRDKHNGGTVTFGKAFLVGFYITLIASTMYVATWAIEYNCVYPDFMEKYSSSMVSHAKNSGMSQAKIDAKIKEMAMYSNMYKNPIFFTLMTYAEILPAGILVSLISALILKKKKATDTN